MHGSSFQGFVKRAEPCKCDILLVSRILWHKRIIASLKNGDFHIWYSRANFRHNCTLQVNAAPFHWRLHILIRKNSWRRVLEANKTVRHFQSIKYLVEQNNLLSKFFSSITWLDVTMDDLKTRFLRQILLFLRNNSLAV